MERLLLQIPSHLCVTTMGDPTTTDVNPGVKYWIEQNAIVASVVCDPVTPDRCSIQFASNWDMVNFKLHFGINRHPTQGGIALTLVKKSAAEFQADRKYRIKMMQSEHSNLYFRLKKQHGWWQLACPILANAGYVYHKSWKQMSFSMRTGKHRFNIEELVELAHELRQIYVDAPIMMVNSKGELIDVTELDCVMIQLMH